MTSMHAAETLSSIHGRSSMKPVNRQAAAGMSYAPSQTWRPERVLSSDHVLTKEAQAQIRREYRDKKSKRQAANPERSKARRERLAVDHEIFQTLVLPTVADLTDDKTLLYEPIADRLNEAGNGRANGLPWDGKTIRKMLRKYRPDLFGLPSRKTPAV